MNKHNNQITETSSSNFAKEQYYRATFDNAFIGIVVIDSNDVIIETNAAFCQLTGYRDEELSSKTFISLLIPDDAGLHAESSETLLSGTSRSASAEIRLYNKSREIIWIRSSYSLVKDVEDNISSILIVCMNISEEKRAQQKAEDITKRFRFLADSMPQLIWTADGDGKLNYFSHAFCEYLGIRFEDTKSTDWNDIVFSEDKEETCSLWYESIASGEEFVMEHRLRRRDGNYTWQLSRAMAQRDGTGKIILWVGATSNIHRQKTVAEELEKQVLERTRDLQLANFNLKHSNHDLEQFAYIATHDLQEPLRKIRTYASWISKRHMEHLPEEAQEYVSKIENSSERMSVLIDDLLNYSLLLRPQEDYEICDLNSILQHALTEFANVINSLDVSIHTSELPSLKVVPAQIYLLFYNIISNSLKFVVEGRKPVIDITSRIVSEEEIIISGLDIDLTYIEIAFKDNGIGFMQEYAEKVFSIFQRLNSRNKYPGTGIGLALCQKIVDYHHGRIYAKAKENEGATIFIQLPL